MAVDMRSLLIALVLIEGAISTIGVTPILLYAMERRELPTIFAGIRALSGPFERLGIDGLVTAGLVFVALSSLKFLAAWWLAGGRVDGAVLQLVLLGASSLFWYGFAVPYGPVLGIPQVVLIAVVWRQLA